MGRREGGRRIRCVAWRSETVDVRCNVVAMTDHERTIPTSGHIAAEHAVPTCGRMKTIAVPDFEVLFADYKGSKPQEDEFVKCVGRERL